MIGELLRLYRSVKNISIRDMANEIGTSSATLSRIENGKTCDMFTFLLLINWLFEKENQ